jgi:hypothetical protein
MASSRSRGVIRPCTTPYSSTTNTMRPERRATAPAVPCRSGSRARKRRLRHAASIVPVALRPSSSSLRHADHTHHIVQRARGTPGTTNAVFAAAPGLPGTGPRWPASSHSISDAAPSARSAAGRPGETRCAPSGARALDQAGVHALLQAGGYFLLGHGAGRDCRCAAASAHRACTVTAGRRRAWPPVATQVMGRRPARPRFRGTAGRCAWAPARQT